MANDEVYAGGLLNRALDPTTQPTPVPRPDLGPGVQGLAAAAVDPSGEAVTVAAVPYHAWGNRSVAAMRVWIPGATVAGTGDTTG